MGMEGDTAMVWVWVWAWAWAEDTCMAEGQCTAGITGVDTLVECTVEDLVAMDRMEWYVVVTSGVHMVELQSYGVAGMVMAMVSTVLVPYYRAFSDKKTLFETL